jgi:hypothetical protein
MKPCFLLGGVIGSVFCVEIIKTKYKMEEKLNEIIKAHENNLLKYTQERDTRLAKMQFMSEHKFEHESQHLRTQKDAVSDMFFDYRKAIEDLRELLNAWNS